MGALNTLPDVLKLVPSTTKPNQANGALGAACKHATRDPVVLSVLRAPSASRENGRRMRQRVLDEEEQYREYKVQAAGVRPGK